MGHFGKLAADWFIWSWDIWVSSLLIGSLDISVFVFISDFYIHVLRFLIFVYFCIPQFGVVSLFNLLVREKCDTRDTKGIYLINQNKNNPEMYEIVFNNSIDMHKWGEALRNAVENCPEEGKDAGCFEFVWLFLKSLEIKPHDILTGTAALLRIINFFWYNVCETSCYKLCTDRNHSCWHQCSVL